MITGMNASIGPVLSMPQCGRNHRRDALQAHLKARGIGTGIHYPIPIHLQDAFVDLGYRHGDFPVTERAVTEIVSLPMYAELTPDQVSEVADRIMEFVERLHGEPARS